MSIRNKYEEELKRVFGKLVAMCRATEQAIDRSVTALRDRNAALSREVMEEDRNIDNMERDIEQDCLKILLMEHPVAGDFRDVSAALKMITDLERIGDQASDIAEIITFIDKKAGVDCEPICLMAEATIRMVTESVDAFVKRDVGIAQQAIAHDDTVDDYFLKVKRSLINMIAQRPADGEHALDLLMIAKYFERIGDHAVNIAEWVIFSVTGVHKGQTV